MLVPSHGVAQSLLSRTAGSLGSQELGWSLVIEAVDYPTLQADCHLSLAVTMLQAAFECSV